MTMKRTIKMGGSYFLSVANFLVHKQAVPVLPTLNKSNAVFVEIL